MPVTNVNLFGQNPDAYALQSEYQQAEMAKKLAEMLLAQPSQGQGVIPAGRTVAADISPLGEIFAKTRANRDLTEAQAKQAQLSQILNALQNREMGQFDQKLFGGVEGPRTSPQEMGPMPPTQPSPVEAVRMGQQSFFPAVQKRAEQVEKGFATPQDLARLAPQLMPASLAAMQATQQAGSLVPHPKISTEGGVISTISPLTGERTSAEAVQRFGPPKIEPQSGLVTQTGLTTGREEPLTTGYPPQSKYGEEIAKTEVAQLAKGRETYLNDAARLGFIKQVQSDLATLPASAAGSLAGLRTTVNKFAELLGAPPVPENSTKEVIHSALGQLMLQDIRKLAPVTTQDIAEIRTIIGTESNTKRALERIMALMERSTIESLSAHTGFVQQLAKRPGAGENFVETWAPGISERTPFAPPAVPKSPDKAIVDDLVKRYGKPR